MLRIYAAVMTPKNINCTLAEVLISQQIFLSASLIVYENEIGIKYIKKIEISTNPDKRGYPDKYFNFVIH